MRRLFPLLALLCLLGLRFHQPPNTVDDAYITFRYARNLANGVGFVYNAGEQVMGTTTPAYAMLLATLSRLTGLSDFPRLALFTNALFDALTFCVLLRLGTRLLKSRWLALALSALVAIDGRLLDWSTGGMEASFNVFTITLTWLLLFEDRTRWAALTAALAILIRPDGATLTATVFAVLGWEALRQRRALAQWPWREAAISAAVLVPWLIFTLIYFGTPIPQSVLAKSVVYRLPPFIAVRAFLVQLRTIFPFSFPPVAESPSIGEQFLQAALPLALCGVGLYFLARRHPRAWGFGLYLVLFTAFFSVGNPLWLGWYETPLMSHYWLLMLAVVAYMPGVRPLWRLPLALAFTLLLVLPQLSRINLLPWETPRNPPFVLNPTFNKRREADYQLIASMLRPYAAENRLAAIPEIGAFGYVYTGPVFDTTGLTSPAAVGPKYFPIPPEIPIEIYSVPKAMPLDFQWDLFVSFDSFIQATIPLDDADFLRVYRPTVGLTSHAAFGVQRLMAYRRADVPGTITLPPSVTPVAVRFGDDLVELTGYATRQWTDEGQPFFEVLLVWHNLSPDLNRDLLARVNLHNAAGETVYQVLDYPGETYPESGLPLFPSSQWSPGFWLVDRYQLKRPMPEVGPYTVSITLFTTDADAPLTAHANNERLPNDTFVITSSQP